MESIHSFAGITASTIRTRGNRAHRRSAGQDSGWQERASPRRTARTRRHQKGPWQLVGKVCGRLAIFGEVQHESAPLWRV